MFKRFAVCATLVMLAGCLARSPVQVPLPVEPPPQYHGLLEMPGPVCRSSSGGGPSRMNSSTS